VVEMDVCNEPTRPAAGLSGRRDEERSLGTGSRSMGDGAQREPDEDDDDEDHDDDDDDDESAMDDEGYAGQVYYEDDDHQEQDRPRTDLEKDTALEREREREESRRGKERTDRQHEASRSAVATPPPADNDPRPSLPFLADELRPPPLFTGGPPPPPPPPPPLPQGGAQGPQWPWDEYRYSMCGQQHIPFRGTPEVIMEKSLLEAHRYSDNLYNTLTAGLEGDEAHQARQEKSSDGWWVVKSLGAGYFGYVGV
jgi:hypothetical protein